MSQQTDDPNWVPTEDDESQSISTGGAETIPIKPTLPPPASDLTAIEGVTLLSRGSAPADLVQHTRSDDYDIRGYYQVDNLTRFRTWRSLLTRSGGQEVWLFYACPAAIMETVLLGGKPLPYGEFFPRYYGPDALYFYTRAGSAARAAFKFGLEQEGFLVSCRVLPGKTFRTRVPYPQAARPPQGFDAIVTPHKADLGMGALDGELYALYDPERALIRYVTHIQKRK